MDLCWSTTAPALSGRDGTNRSPATATRIAATDDLAADTAWLARYADSAATLTASTAARSID